MLDWASLMVGCRAWAGRVGEMARMGSPLYRRGLISTPSGEGRMWDVEGKKGRRGAIRLPRSPPPSQRWDGGDGRVGTPRTTAHSGLSLTCVAAYGPPPPFAKEPLTNDPGEGGLGPLLWAGGAQAQGAGADHTWVNPTRGSPEHTGPFPPSFPTPLAQGSLRRRPLSAPQLVNRRWPRLCGRAVRTRHTPDAFSRSQLGRGGVAEGAPDRSGGRAAGGVASGEGRGWITSAL